MTPSAVSTGCLSNQSRPINETTTIPALPFSLPLPTHTPLPPINPPATQIPPSSKKRFHPYSSSFSSKKPKSDLLLPEGCLARVVQVKIAQSVDGQNGSEIAGVEGFNLPPPPPAQ
jgi:hypothetical protein